MIKKIEMGFIKTYLITANTASTVKNSGRTFIKHVIYKGEIKSKEDKQLTRMRNITEITTVRVRDSPSIESVDQVLLFELLRC